MNCSLIVFLLYFVFFSFSACANDKDLKETWVYDKVSEVDVFGKHDKDVIKHLNEAYSQVVIDVNEKKLSINNNLLENSQVCTIDYIKIKTSPISYFLSQKTVDMYKQVFIREGMQLPKNVNMLTSVFPNLDCPAPYNELLDVGSRLMVLERNYVLFFKRPNNVSNATDYKKVTLSSYCHSDNPAEIFDGTSKENCNFPGMNLKKAYDKLRTATDNRQNYLEETMPFDNLDCHIDDKSISYKWDGAKLLKISVVMDNESITYSFSELATGTELIITTESQY